MMRRTIASGFLAVTLLASLSPTAVAGELDEVVEFDELAEQDDSDANGSFQPLVYNGVSVSNPGWVVSITASGFYTCSGTLVHHQWVLTAAHCVDKVDSSYRINVGGDRWFEGTQRQLASVHIHPQYDQFDLSSVDLAMVKLALPVSGVTTPKLNSSPSWPLIGQQLVVLGWGETSDGSSIPDHLQGAWVEVNSDSTGVRTDGYPYCFETWVAASGYEDFCFGGVSWACRGDSGGPLVGRATPTSTSGSIETTYGVTSFGDGSGCSSAHWDTIGQATGPHFNWIQSFYNPSGSPGPGDEMFFYRTDGLFRYYDVRNDATLGKPINAGDDYTTGWDTIIGIDLDGDGQDEISFYRKDGLFRYYDVRPDGTLPKPMLAGDGYTKNWDAITAVDLDGDGQDEIFFYRKDGLFRYYDIKPNGEIGRPILAGTGYTKNWTSITAIDLEGDGKDEMFFYRDDGLFRYYSLKSDASLGSPINAGNGYTTGWTSITTVDLNG